MTDVEVREAHEVGRWGAAVAAKGPLVVVPRQARQDEGDVPGTRTDLDTGFLVLESCHSTWLFDPDNLRFCRVLKGAPAEPSVATEWRSYHRLVLHPGSDAFVVFLDISGTRLLRSWRHTAYCDQCGGDATAEMSLEDLRRVARA